MVVSAGRLGVLWVYGEIGGVIDMLNLDEYFFIFYSVIDEWMVGVFFWDYSKSKGGFGIIDADIGDWYFYACFFL